MLLKWWTFESDPHNSVCSVRTGGDAPSGDYVVPTVAPAGDTSVTRPHCWFTRVSVSWHDPYAPREPPASMHTAPGCGARGSQPRRKCVSIVLRKKPASPSLHRPADTLCTPIRACKTPDLGMGGKLQSQAGFSEWPDAWSKENTSRSQAVPLCSGLKSHALY